MSAFIVGCAFFLPSHWGLPGFNYFLSYQWLTNELEDVSTSLFASCLATNCFLCQVRLQRNPTYAMPDSWGPQIKDYSLALKAEIVENEPFFSKQQGQGGAGDSPVVEVPESEEAEKEDQEDELPPWRRPLKKRKVVSRLSFFLLFVCLLQSSVGFICKMMELQTHCK